MENLVPIGRFSKICRLSISALRYYDELGLLRPALVDPDSSYRYYLLSQVPIAETIRLLRALEMPLDEVRHYLVEEDHHALRNLLNGHQRRMEERVEEGQRILSYLRRLQGGEEDALASPVHACHVAPQDVLSIQACVPELEVSGTRRALADEIQAYMRRAGQSASGPVGTIFPDLVHSEEAVHLTVFIPVTQSVKPTGRITAEKVPGGLAATIMHHGPNILLNRSYGQLVSWMQRHGHEVSGSPREIYWLGPTETDDPNGYQTEIIWPVR